jgi:hypothetical protein
MGFLKTYGRPLDWEESKIYFDYIKKDALDKVIDWINATKKLSCVPKFGYEIELHKVYVDDEEKKALIDLSGNCDVVDFKDTEEKNFILQHEFGKWMVESNLM